MPVTDLLTGPVHLDFDAGNVLENDGKVAAILDFDDLAFAPLAACLGNTLWHVFVEADSTKMAKYLKSYVAHRKLSIVFQDITRIEI